MAPGILTAIDNEITKISLYLGETQFIFHLPRCPRQRARTEFPEIDLQDLQVEIHGLLFLGAFFLTP